MSAALLRKSEENLISARFLLNDPRTHCNSSAQCSYYGCLQVALHSLVQKFGSEDKLRELFEEFKDKGNRGNTHAFYITSVRNHLASAGFSDFAKTFNKTMFELKSLREDASYHMIIVDKATSEQALSKAKDISDTLRRILKL